MNERIGFHWRLVLLVVFWGAHMLSCEQTAHDDIPRPLSTLDYIMSISDKEILAGQHNREPNADPDKWTEWIHTTTGKYPALWSGDFLFQAENIEHRWTMIKEAQKQARNGAVVHLMWHACNPVLGGEPCGWESSILTKMSDEDWTQLVTDGTSLNRIWCDMMDEVAIYLQFLEDAGVEILFRPLHEMNQGAFWWGGRPGPGGTTKLYRIIHNYLCSTKGLSNLIWIWDLQDFTTLENDLINYDPGGDYWDILALDFYEVPLGCTMDKYEKIVKAAGGKPIAIGECTTLPTSAELAQQPRWTFFMPWAELVASNNTTEEIRVLYSDPRVVTLD